jgi:4-hydroxy-4-methyl-2-oxoglutarate aldolase
MSSNTHTVVDEVVAALRDLGAATVYEAQGGHGALASAIKPIDPASCLAGRALTVDAAPADNLVIHYALTRAQPGDVIVIDAKGFVEAGPWGDVLTEAALAQGIAGLVIDGAVRDSASIAAMQFPVFARGVSIKGTGKNQPGRVGEPITIGGVAVRSGGVIVGDRDGVVVVAAEEAEKTLQQARERKAKEDGFRRVIREGRTTVELMHLEESLTRLHLA